MKHFVAGFAVAARTALTGSVGALALAAPGIALAQSPAAPSPAAQEEAQPAADLAEVEQTGNEIVVTATKREQTLQDVPVAVTVTSAETLERAQIRDIRDLSTVVPSLRVNTLQSSANTNFYIRGFGNGANNAGIEPSVGLFVDGVYRSRSASMISDLPDVQRIEVLRGPQSTLFGKNASAGVISLVTKEPQFRLAGNFEASYGNYNAIVAKGYITAPLGEHVAASLAGGYNKRDGYVSDLGSNTKSNERNRWFVRGQVLIEPSSDLKLRLIGDYSKIDENCCAVVNLRQAGASAAVLAVGGKLSDPANPFADVTYANLPSTNKIDNWGLSGQIDYNMGLLKLTSITAYRRTKALTNQDSDFSSADLLGQNSQDLRINTFTQEFRVNTDWEGPLNLLVGAFYFNEKIKQSNQVNWGNDARNYASLLIQSATGCPAGPNCSNVSGLEAKLSALSGVNLANTFFRSGQGLTEAYALKDESYSLFAQGDYKLGERLTFTGGVNYIHDTKSFDTNTSSNDVFAGLDLAALGQKAILVQGLQNAGVNPPTPAAIFAFATNPATAPIYNAIAAFAAGNRNNPAVNSLLGLRPLQFFPPFQNLPNAVETGQLSDGHWNFTARVAFDATDHINVYAGYATGYKAASVNLSRDSRPSPADLTSLVNRGIAVTNLTSGSRYADPEKSTVYEAGLKANWGLATANVAVFKQSIEGFQSNIFSGTGFLLLNAGKQSAFGVEFEGTVKPVPELTLSLGATYLDAKYDDFKVTGVGDLTGSRPAGASPLSATFAAQWNQDLGNGDHLILRGDYHYEAPFQLVEGLPNLVNLVGNAGAVKAARDLKQEISLLNGSLTYAMANGVELTVWGRNIMKKRTILQIFDSPAQQGSISGYPSEPRTYGVAARFRW